ncbi:MAG: hypothetical protein KAR14_11510 [Candidatus Aminicenantes bacterium]|nr:hypothetical protein [Candidatus Aminicenantes bacterium]
MRVLILIVIILLFPFGLTRSQDQFNTGGDNFEDTSPDGIIDNGEEGSIEDDFLSLEPDIFSRKLYQKNLKPLTDKDKIIWSFKMADIDIFL